MTSAEQDGQKKQGVVMRWNVLILLSIAYGTLLIVFGVVVWKADVTTASNIITTPLMALIGGTLAVVKDLL